jgi:hypothetical protein
MSSKAEAYDICNTIMSAFEDKRAQCSSGRGNGKRVCSCYAVTREVRNKEMVTWQVRCYKVPVAAISGGTMNQEDGLFGWRVDVEVWKFWVSIVSCLVTRLHFEPANRYGDEEGSVSWALLVEQADDASLDPSEDGGCRFFADILDTYLNISHMVAEATR